MPTIRNDIVLNERYGKWVVVGTPFNVACKPSSGSRLKRGYARQSNVLCRCECGVARVIPVSNLKGGRSTQCKGCKLRGEATTHGQSKTPTYLIYQAMKKRIRLGREGHPHHTAYKDLEIEQDWVYSYESFLADMGERPGTEYSLDREDCFIGYVRGNVRWVTQDVQAANKKYRLSLTVRGETLWLTEWAKRTGIKYHTLLKRFTLGKSPEEIVTPVRGK